MTYRRLLAAAAGLLLAAGCASVDVKMTGVTDGNPDDAKYTDHTPMAYQQARERRQTADDLAEIVGDRQAEPGWSEWRGPYQNGVSDESGLPDTLNADNTLWTLPIRGRGTPVTHGNRLYTMGYTGTGPGLREYLLCLDAATGQEHWRLGFNDFLSDIIYERYSIGAPSIDPRTGSVYALTSAGELVCVSPNGQIRWIRSLMEEFGRLTFPNGRTGSPTLDGDLVIVNMINSNWGAEGPGRNRFYAFHRSSGELVWSSTPGVGPPYLRDSSFSTPVFETRRGMRLMYATTGCGNVVGVNALTGEPLWRYQMAEGGVNASPVIAGDRLVVVHGKENVDDTGRGRMVALNLDHALDAATADTQAGEPVLLDRAAELWRNDAISQFTSSPVVKDGTIYQITATGELYSVDLASGKTNWHQKLGADQLHASPVWADNKLYIPMWHDGLQVIRPGATPDLLSKTQLDGDCIGSPAVWAGRVYVHTTQALYCFGSPEGGPAPTRVQPDPLPAPGPTVALQIQPAQVLLRPGVSQRFQAYPVDAVGIRTGAPATAAWAKWIPPNARVKAELDADITDDGTLRVDRDASQSAGAIRAVSAGKAGVTRGRIVPAPPYHEDFESFTLAAKDASGEAFAYPPLPWIGARVKWDVREHNGNKVLAKTLDNVLFQRAISFIGHPGDRDYTIQADIMSDGSRRNLGTVGVINQRYIIALVGNWQILEVSSNHDRIKYSVPYKWKPNTWYTLKTQVQVTAAGGTVRAKVWPTGEDEPADWTLEMTHDIPHTHGAPGLFGFSPQSQYKVYVDNIHIQPNR